MWKLPADCPLPRGGPSSVQPTCPTRNRRVSIQKFSNGGGPSAPKDRTVRSSFWTPKTELLSFCARFSFLKADRPPPWTGRSAVHFGHPRQNYQVSAPVSAFKGGLSAPMDRAVRSSFWTTNRAKNGSVRAHPI